VDARPDPFDQRRLADEDIHEVDAASARLLPSLNLDQRIHRVRAIRQEDVRIRRHQPEHDEHDDE
jgi:hypothetical protein